MTLRDLLREQRTIDGLSFTAGGLLAALVWAWIYDVPLVEVETVAVEASAIR